MAKYTQLQKNDIPEIAGNYDLTVIDFEPIEGGAANSSFLLHTQHGDYILTIFDKKTMADVVNLEKLLLLMAKHDFPTSRLRRSLQGQSTTVFQGKPVILKVYISGQVNKDLDHAGLVQVGAHMARLHQIPAPDFLPVKHGYGRQTFASFIGRNINPAYESWLADQLTHLQHRIPPGLPNGLIHGDLFYDNVLFAGNQLQAIIDFEEACCYYKVFDLGMGIVGLCTQESTVALDKAQALVAGYERVRLLEKKEKEALRLFVEYAATATSRWRFWKYYIDKPNPELADKPWQMVRIANSVRAIPSLEFISAVY